MRYQDFPSMWSSLSYSTSLQTWQTSPSEIRWKSTTRKQKSSLSTSHRNLTFSLNYTSLTVTHLRWSTRPSSLVSPSPATSAGPAMWKTSLGGQLKSSGSWSGSSPSAVPLSRSLGIGIGLKSKLLIGIGIGSIWAWNRYRYRFHTYIPLYRYTDIGMISVYTYYRYRYRFDLNP